MHKYKCGDNLDTKWSILELFWEPNWCKMGPGNPKMAKGGPRPFFVDFGRFWFGFGHMGGGQVGLMLATFYFRNLS